jgi:Lon protease-like protein
MFPLGTVLFPYGVLPLHVFEPRYRMMVRDCLRDAHEFGVVLIERGSEVGGGDVRFGTGTLARIVRVSELDGGRYALTAVGLRRIRVEAWLDDDPYPQAHVVVVEEPALAADALDAARAARDRVEAALQRLLALWSTIEPRAAEVKIELSTDPQQASFEAASAAPIGPLDAQRVLEADGTTERLAQLESLLQDEIEVLEARRPGD